MSVDLDDPWTEDALARPGPPSRAGSSSSNGLNNVAVIQPRSDSTSNSDDSGWGWSPTSPFTPVEDLHTAVARGSPSPTHSPRSSPSLDPNLGFKLNASDPGPKASKLPKQAKHRQKPRRPGPHPLAPGMDGLSLTSDTDISDVSRPALRRATSITERAVAESQEQSRCGSEVGSSRGSVDLARAEVEVIVHQVKRDESLPGIALRYGIELAVLRKVNKLWPSDPVHLRNHLYIPLEACKPTTKGDHIVRGPGSGQVTIVPRRRRASANGTRPEGGDQTSEPSWGSSSANGIFDGHRPGTPDTIKAGSGSNGIGASDEPDEQILDIVRLPASQLRFFPRGKRETPRSRTSLDGDIGKSADSVRSLNAVERARRREARERDREVSGGAGAAARAAVFAPLGALSAAAGAVAQPRKNVVRLRPPQAPTPTDDSFAGQLRSLFSVPPPPVPVSRSASARVPPAHVRTESADSASDSARLAHAHMRVEVEMEMDARPWSGASTPPRTLRKTDKKRD